MPKIIVEFKPVTFVYEKVTRNRRKIVEAIEKAIAELKLLEDDQYTVNFSYE